MYCAYIIEVDKVDKHPNADRLQIIDCYGSTVIVDMSVKRGDIGIYFPTDGQLSEDFVKENKLLKKDGGYLENNRRVKHITLRKVKSEGLYLPLSCLSYLKVDLKRFVPGQFLTTVNDKEICRKYITPKTKTQQNKIKFKRKGETPYFKKHMDTGHYRFNKFNIKPNELIYITEKLHGTSGRYGFIPKEQSKIRSLLGLKNKYGHEMGTRKTIIDKVDSGYYNSHKFRYDAVKEIELRKGETIYFELVGYVDKDTLIMPSVSTEILGDINFTAKYGSIMTYRYSCEPGENKLFVYRITQTDEEGLSYDLSFSQVMARCNELNILHVPLLQDPFLFNGNYDDLSKLVEHHSVGSSTIDMFHIREGVCVRIEGSKFQPKIYKNKSWEFGVLEGYLKDDDNYTDLEESS